MSRVGIIPYCKFQSVALYFMTMDVSIENSSHHRIEAWRQRYFFVEDKLKLVYSCLFFLHLELVRAILRFLHKVG